MRSRLFFAALPIAIAVGTMLYATPSYSQSEAPLKPAIEAALKRLVPCPAEHEVVDIEGSTDAFTRRKQMIKLITMLGRDGTTVRLGPNVDLDFSELPDRFFPIFFGRCVTLTSVSAFIDAERAPSVAGTIMHNNPGQVPSFGDLTPGIVPSTTEARSPRSLGPVLRYGKHRKDIQKKTFLEIHCYSPDGPDNDGARISGFRLYGPAFGQQSTIEVAIRMIRCVDVDISNMEIAGWGGDGISVQDDPGPDHPSESNVAGGRIMNPEQVRIHDNFFHHNQHPTKDSSAEGYGVNIGDGAWALISRNVFDFNRHAIATGGGAGGYVAERNLVLKGGGYQGNPVNKYEHSFDAHGTANCWAVPGEDIWIWGSLIGWTHHLWNCGDAGIQFEYLDNAFQYSKDNDIKIRGKPAIQVFINGNVFPFSDFDDAVSLYTNEHAIIGPANVTGFDSFGRYGVCDFDGDGVDDLFLATGATWWFSSFGEFHWTYLNASKMRLDKVRLGYFDDDLRCDVLSEQNGQWLISSGATGDWRPLGAFGVPLSEAQFGRFNPNLRDHRPGMTRRITHAFRRAPDGQWFVTPLTGPDWMPVQSSSLAMNQLRFGDFNGDGVTDVLAVVNGHWAVSESATHPWRNLNASLGDAVGNLFIANMDSDDNIDDIMRLDVQTKRIQVNGMVDVRTTLTWWRSKNGIEPWRRWKDYFFEFIDSPEVVAPVFGFAGRFGVAPGGGTLIIGPDRLGHFYSASEIEAGAAPDWTSQFPY